MTARADLADEIKRTLVDPRAVCEALGLVEGYRPVRQAGGLLIRCPARGERNPSCSVTRGPDGTLRVRCFSCDLSGDVHNLVAAARGLDVRADFREVLREGAELAGLEVDEAPSSPPRARPPRPVTPPAPPPTFPPAAEVAALWAGCAPVSDDPEVAAYLAGRGIDPETVDLYGLARVLPVDVTPPSWARCGRPWGASGHRLILPTFDARGTHRSLRAWRIVTREGPKRVAPTGHSTAGLVLACPIGRRLLEQGPQGARRDVVIVEGEPDLLSWATSISDANETPPAVIGVFASAWTTELAARIPDGSRVIVRTHRDDAGDRYAADIRTTLAGRVELYDYDRGSDGQAA